MKVNVCLRMLKSIAKDLSAIRDLAKYNENHDTILYNYQNANKRTTKALAKIAKLINRCQK